MKKSAFIKHNNTPFLQSSNNIQKTNAWPEKLPTAVNQVKERRLRNKQNLVFQSLIPEVSHHIQESKSKGYFTMKIEDFEIGDFLGKGSYGTVRVGRHTKTGFFYSVKTLKRKMIQQDLDRFIKGLKIQMFLNHPNIIQVYGLIVQQKQIHIIMQLCVDGDLSHNFRQISKDREKSVQIMRGVAVGIKYLHSMRIMHRDLKLQNIMFSYDMPKISDFDLATYIRVLFIPRKTICGSPAYFSPEMLLKNSYNINADIWSLGIIFYELLCGYFPFKCQNLNDLKDKTMESLPFDCCEDGRNLINGMLQKNETKRFTIDEVISHRFLRYKEKIAQQ